MCVLLNGVFYVLPTGCAWRHLPRDFPPWQTTLRWFLRLARSGAFERMAHALVMADHEWAGRDASPTAAVVDAQVARAGGSGVAGRAAATMPPSAWSGANATPVYVALVGSTPGQRGFAVQPCRWVIERTFAWNGRCRRLARGHEATPGSAIAFFVIAAATVLLRRLATPL